MLQQGNHEPVWEEVVLVALDVLAMRAAIQSVQQGNSSVCCPPGMAALKIVGSGCNREPTGQSH